MVNVLSYFFFFLLCISSLCVVLLQNSFFALLFLILSFLLVSIILFFLECEFLALMLVIVYLGAVATLLLFVLMMLETKLKNVSKEIIVYFPFGIFINGIFFLELASLISKSFNDNFYTKRLYFNTHLNFYNILDSLMDLEIYGQLLYTQFVLQVLIVGLILFLVLVGVIFLTTKPIYKNFKGQTLFCQLSRSYLEQHFKLRKSSFYVGNLFSSNFLSLDLSSLKGVAFNQIQLPVRYIQAQELIFLSEYFLISALFCLTLFALFSLKAVVEEKHFSMKFQFNNQSIFLLIFVLTCYLILVYQQIHLSLLTLTSFNDTIYNDQLAFIFKLIIVISSILYIIFIAQYLQDQKLSNSEYYIILLTSIFGFFLLCGANDLITAYLAIELQGLAFYVLASFKKSSNFSIESGVKYFVLGSLSTAFFLLGITFIYGFSGSLLLTDFKDLFIWVFSTNNFLSFFESSQFDVGLNSPKIKLYSKVSEKFMELYSQIDSTSLFSYQDYLRLVGKNFLQLLILISSVNDFLLETGFQDASAEFFYTLQEKQLEYKSFVGFKDNLLEASYYENSDQFLTETVHFKGESTNLFRIYSNIEGHSCSNNTNSLLQCCYFSDCVSTVLNFSVFFQSHNSVLDIVSLEADLRLIFNLKIYMFSVINIVNLNCLFLKPSEQIVTYESIFDFSFVVLGMLVIILALFFKLALAPFHIWVSDVYEGSPSSSTFFFMVISKISIFVFLLRMCYSSFYSLISYWQFYSLIVGTLSVFIGAVVGLKQRKLKSLLTYSSINNTGFVLLAFSIGSFEGIQTQFYYLITYTLGSIGIWGTILNLKLKKKMYFEKQNKDLGDLALLQECNHIIAQNLGLMLFSLAGLPPTIGFLAKMSVFKALTGVSMYFFVIINILFSVIATFYYLRITKIIFFENTLVGNLYETINSKKTFLINIISFALLGLFISPMFLYLASYKITLFLNKTFY